MSQTAQGTVVCLDEFRKSRSEQGRCPRPAALAPRINDGEIFARNYATLDGVLFGVLKIREILEYHLDMAGEWQYLLLSLLDAAHAWQGGDQDRLNDMCDATLALKGLIFETITPDNHRQLSNALLLLDLIQKAPTYKRATGAPIRPGN